jgi:hypothetical protein
MVKTHTMYNVGMNVNFAHIRVSDLQPVMCLRESYDIERLMSHIATVRFVSTIIVKLELY